MKIILFFIQLMAMIIMITPFFIVEKVEAHEVGVMGETYPIIEMDFLSFIQSRIRLMQQNGQWQSLQRHMQSEAESYRDRPTKVPGLTRTIEAKSWQFDPSIIIDHDVIAPNGNLIALAGTRVNPLEHTNLSKTLIFYDADDQEQRQWAINYDKKIAGKDKLILVNGSLLGEEKQFLKSIYFDQSGILTTRFGIHHVPAIIKQEGLLLHITEVKI
jgi:conjugal transfer pilus assembly protein TraW